MKKYTIELSDDLSTEYDKLAKSSNQSAEIVMQTMLKAFMDSILKDRKKGRFRQ